MVSWILLKLKTSGLQKRKTVNKIKRQVIGWKETDPNNTQIYVIGSHN